MHVSTAFKRAKVAALGPQLAHADVFKRRTNLANTLALKIYDFNGKTAVQTHGDNLRTPSVSESKRRKYVGAK